MDRSKAKILGEEMEQALQLVAKRHGVQIRAGRGAFTKTTFEARFEVAETVKGVAQTPERATFARMVKLYGLATGDLGKTFSQDGYTFKIVGLNTRRRRYPVVVERQPDGKRFKFGAEAIVRALGKKGE